MVQFYLVHTVAARLTGLSLWMALVTVVFLVELAHSSRFWDMKICYRLVQVAVDVPPILKVLGIVRYTTVCLALSSWEMTHCGKLIGSKTRLIDLVNICEVLMDLRLRCNI